MFANELQQRGLIHQVSSAKLFDATGLVLFAGFDPTADSLHIGHLLPLLALKRAALTGNHPIALIGGATGLIGDPSGKSAERSLISAGTVQANVAAISAQIKRCVPEARIVNNADWFNQINILDFLRDTGKHFSVNAMLARDAVKSRLDSETGISFTEFSYILLQAFDFLHLNREFGCTLQIGGSDQWGNIASGIDLIRREGREAFGITLPLITNSNGEKFGKTAKGAVWLDAAKTTPNELFQFFFNTPDADVVRLINFFTFAEPRLVKELEEHTKAEPQHRTAQTFLAKEVCRFIHSTDGQDMPILHVGEGSLLLDALVQAKFCSSRNDARNQIRQSAVRLNDTTITDTEKRISCTDFGVLAKGKKFKCRLEKA